MEKICGIILGGQYSKINISSEVDFVIACDKGYKYAVESGINPDLFVGDFDSFNGKVPSNVKILELPTEKDDTDALAAVRYALKQGYRRIEFYCAFGKRIDHFFGNIQVCAFVAEHGGIAYMQNEETSICVFSNQTVKIPEKEGYSLSVLSLSDVCRGVTLNGVKYKIDKFNMTNTFPIGVSNEWNGLAEISVEDGIIMTVLSKM